MAVTLVEARERHARKVPQIAHQPLADFFEADVFADERVAHEHDAVAPPHTPVAIDAPGIWECPRIHAAAAPGAAGRAERAHRPSPAFGPRGLRAAARRCARYKKVSNRRCWARPVAAGGRVVSAFRTR